MTKEELLSELSKETFACLQSSPVHGIGVFAMIDIPKGCQNIFSKNVGNWIQLPIADVEKLPAHSKNLVETYCLFDEEFYYVPDYGFKVMDMVNYLNHSSIPNLKSINNGENYEAIVDIPAGAELFIDYGEVANVEGYN
jgi:SET domain-containing protein